MTPANRRRRRKALLLAAFAVTALVLGLLMVQKYAGRKSTLPQMPADQPGAVFSAVLFFAGSDGTALARETRDIERSEELSADVESLLDELVNGPLGELLPTLPPNTRISSVEVKGELAVVDFGSGLTEALPSGSQAELLAAYSVVDSICQNFPQIKRVQILVGGDRLETLKGHLDIREPLGPDYTLEKK